MEDKKKEHIEAASHYIPPITKIHSTFAEAKKSFDGDGGFSWYEEEGGVDGSRQFGARKAKSNLGRTGRWKKPSTPTSAGVPQRLWRSNVSRCAASCQRHLASRELPH